MEILRKWTLLITDEYSLPRPTGTTMHTIDPTPEGPPPAPPPRRWWAGAGTLTFEGLTWSGGQMSDGMLMDFSDVERTPNFQEGIVTARLALGNDALRRALAVDFGPLHVELGWIRSADYGRTWRRLPTYHRGQLDEIPQIAGVLEVNVVAYSDTIDRGHTRLISAGTHRDLSEMSQIRSLAARAPVFE